MFLKGRLGEGIVTDSLYKIDALILSLIISGATITPFFSLICCLNDLVGFKVKFLCKVVETLGNGKFDFNVLG